MNKISYKGFLVFLLIIIILLLSVTALSALARTDTKTVDIKYNNIKITLDGKQITPRDGQGNIVEPFVYNGTTYLPVRAISNALGIAVDWDASTQTVILGTGVESGNWSKDNPAPIGTKINVDYRLSSTPGKSWKGSMFISQVLRGDEAIAQFNQSLTGQNKVGADQEIVLVKVQIDTAPDSASAWYTGLTQFFSGYSGYNDRLSLAAYGTPGDGAGYIWRAYVVERSDTKAKLAFETSGVDYVWFSLN